MKFKSLGLSANALAILLILNALIPSAAKAQLGVGYHQTNLSFLGVNYEIKDRLKPELRVSTNVWDDDFSVEGVVLYDIVNKENYEFYAGAGYRTGVDPGVIFPIGLNIYPLPFKNFGFHIELAPLIVEEVGILRGSWGIRYRFLRESK